MPSDVVALVSADDVVTAVRVHADRVHDLLRRNGQSAAGAFDVANRAASDLIRALIAHPETVVDLAGWWFGACASALSVDPFGAGLTTVDDEGRSVLAGTELESAVRTAVAALPRAQRMTLMLRDAYDLPVQAVAVALGRSAAAASELVADARIQLATAYDGRPVPVMKAHVGRASVDLPGLTALADGSATPATVLTLRRHLEACEACAAIYDAQSRARRLLLGLPVLAMRDQDRNRLIEQTAATADDELPTVEEVLAAAAADSAPRGLPVLLVAAALFLATAIGVGSGVLSRHAQNASAQSYSGVPIPQPPPPTDTITTAPATTTAPARSSPADPRTLPPVIIQTSRLQPTEDVTRSKSAPPSSSTVAPAGAQLTLDPRSGPEGTVIDVDGTGFSPDSAITVSYGSAAAATVISDAFGDWSASITADGALPGTYDVSGSDGGDTASEAFEQSS